MNNWEEIKSLVDASRRAFNKNLVQENIEIKKTYGLLIEQPVENEEKIEDNKDSDKPKMFGQEESQDEEKRTFKIKGGMLSIYGKTKADLQLTLDEKIAFQESMDEFRSEVAELVDFNTLNVFQKNVEWSGLINDRDLEFFFSVAETDGVYIKGDMLKVDDDLMELIEKIKKYYDKFRVKWSKIIASRKETEK
jgi:hypothetical protein